MIKRQPCEIYTRVMWYHRPVSYFNKWKKSEYYNRITFDENKTCNSKFVSQFN